MGGEEKRGGGEKKSGRECGSCCKSLTGRKNALRKSCKSKADANGKVWHTDEEAERAVAASAAMHHRYAQAVSWCARIGRWTGYVLMRGPGDGGGAVRRLVKTTNRHKEAAELNGTGKK